MKIFERQWVLTLLLLPFFKLPIFEFISSLRLLDTMFDIAKTAALAVIVFLYIKQSRISRVILCVVLYQLSLFISTVINNGNYRKLAVSCGTIIGFCMITELFVKKTAGYDIHDTAEQLEKIYLSLAEE